MSYRVRIRPVAVRQIDDGYTYLHDRSPAAAAEWLVDITNAVASLEEFPLRCPVAPEEYRGAAQVRHLFCRTHRISFIVVGNNVSVLHVRHTARAPDPEL
jgi:toxin ParE1/3/4